MLRTDLSWRRAFCLFALAFLARQESTSASRGAPDAISRLAQKSEKQKRTFLSESSRKRKYNSSAEHKKTWKQDRNKINLTYYAIVN